MVVAESIQFPSLMAEVTRRFNLRYNYTTRATNLQHYIYMSAYVCKYVFICVGLGLYVLVYV